ncbi:GntR family transcriptional regulator [Yersinia pseudotuberculosis]|uniref:Amidohydrolase 2 n=2 Tax=Yersinia pseudotuberculosis complex TaxID=1649845 RepID=A0A0H3B2E7_YERPY|nr:amidohydrolase [Yersinia pseudotuberculosis]AJJ58308.1 amidohydrolase family protein [Yersinia pseudotuberculosis YPIII]AYW88204.1 GntR family transcriptional regulator [Yersinia pseudotuberculosis]AYW98952.1 GntR family transcriptional regulator [Yersinia pseudotuberculosis]AZA30514.1 GntR family transcriptional regulator [Yersinia pseudotuberculosis]MBK1424697.1 amidohydrolase [Yersinia pseudotuberculosis]
MKNSSANCPVPFDIMEPSIFALPEDACDSHAHVISPRAIYPMVAERSYTPPPAPEEKYLSMLAATGMSRGVLVQISVYGSDNRYMLKVLKRHPEYLRGVAVVTEDVTDQELQDMALAGVRGLRINVLFGGGIGFDAMENLASKIAPLGWHMQFLMDVRQLPALIPRMKKLPCPCVIDHMGHMPVSLGLNHPGYQTLLHMVREYGWWVKLSGAYRISESWQDGYLDVVPFAQKLIETAPDRMVWGNDWPHVSVSRMPDTGGLRNLLAAWVPDEQVRNRILVDNPARLYDF